MADLLDLQHITKQYARHTAIDDLSLAIPHQSIYGLLGPNGAGKTSLLRIINQITAPDNGSIYFEGEKLSPRHISSIGYLPEERGLYRKMKVGEQALYLGRLKGLSRSETLKKLKYWFEKFEIQTWWNKRIEELSKGMQQKVQFITTVLHAPQLLVLDEPFTGLDPINTGIIKKELIRMNQEGVTILLSTHRMESVEELCTHVALINKARKVLDGTVMDIRKANKTNTYEIEYTGNAIAFANALWTGFELIESVEIDNHHKVILKLLGDSTTNHLLQAILPHVQVLSFKEKIPCMNDIFLANVKDP